MVVARHAVAALCAGATFLALSGPASGDEGEAGNAGKDAGAASEDSPAADRLRAEVDVLVGLPYDELGELAKASAGARLALNYQLDDRISLGLAARWFGVRAKAEGFDVGYRDLAAGGRYQQPLARGLGGFFEFEVLYGTVAVASGLNDLTESDPGVGVRGGLQYWLWPRRVQLWGQAGYSRLFSDSSVPNAEWLEIGLGISLVL